MPVSSTWHRGLSVPCCKLTCMQTFAAASRDEPARPSCSHASGCQAVNLDQHVRFVGDVSRSADANGPWPWSIHWSLTVSYMTQDRDIPWGIGAAGMQHRSAETIRVLTDARPGCQAQVRHARRLDRQTRADRVLATWERISTLGMCRLRAVSPVACLSHCCCSVRTVVWAVRAFPLTVFLALGSRAYLLS